MTFDTKTLSDRLALTDLVYNYAAAADRRDKHLMQSLFTPDAVIIIPGFQCGGVDEFLEVIELLANYKSTLHCVNNHLVTINGDEAEGETYCVAAHLYDEDGVEWKMDWGIRYQDRYVRNDGAWRFSQRELILVWEQNTPLHKRA